MRAAMIMSAYDEARGRGDKHSAAVRYVVDLLKQCNPAIPISQTEVKRVLATWRPRNSRTILRFDRKILSEEDINRHRCIRDQLDALRSTKGLKLEVPPNFDLQRSRTALTIRFAERPNYPRHNRKNPK